MPTYDFQCDDCGHKFTKIVPMGKNEHQCTKCKKTAKKKISAPAVHFSGNGFYVTDSKRKSNVSSDKSTKNTSTSDIKKE